MLGVVNDAAELLHFWLGKLDGGMADEVHRARWFTLDPNFDDKCRRFIPWLEAAASGELHEWHKTPHAMLALIILCDQIPRNCFRGTAAAFGYDSIALQAAMDGVNSGIDRMLCWDERSFFYMPFQHSERIIDQHLAVGLFTSLRDEAPKHLRGAMGNNLRSAQQHRDIILRFGRFPHRNRALGRVSSNAEQQFLEHNNGFGQKGK